jgi:hypothetical protein
MSPGFSSEDCFTERPPEAIFWRELWKEGGEKVFGETSMQRQKDPIHKKAVWPNWPNED